MATLRVGWMGVWVWPLATLLNSTLYNSSFVCVSLRFFFIILFCTSCAGCRQSRRRQLMLYDAFVKKFFAYLHIDSLFYTLYESLFSIVIIIIIFVEINKWFLRISRFFLLLSLRANSSTVSGCGVIFFHSLLFLAFIFYWIHSLKWANISLAMLICRLLCHVNNRFYHHHNHHLSSLYRHTIATALENRFILCVYMPVYADLKTSSA